MPLRISSSHPNCIWCATPFSLDAQSPFHRSEEHIIPECLGGTVITTDVCAGCNNKLGHQIDHLILHSQSIYEAGRAAGFSDNQLLPKRYDAVASSDLGTQVTLRVRDGNSTVVPNLKDATPYIGSSNGKVHLDQRHGLISSIAKQVRATHNLSTAEAIKKSKDLVEKALTRMESSHVVSDSEIGQNIRIENLSSNVLPQLSPRKAIPAVFKILYETLMLFTPPSAVKYRAGIATSLKLATLASAESESMLFKESLAVSASAKHTFGFMIESSKKLSVFVTFFGALRYSTRWSVQNHEIASIQWTQTSALTG
jgi:hypothetical protein